MKRSRLLIGAAAVAVAVVAIVAVATSGGASSNRSSSGSGSSYYAPSSSAVPRHASAPATTAPPAAPATAPAPAAAPAPAPAAVPASAAVHVAHDAALGDILVAGNGHTVYLFTKDQGTTSACTGPCAMTWPAWMTGGAPTAGPGVAAAMLGSAHGQVTYAGHLLYFFAGDQAPGQTNGIGIPSWFAVSPTGMPLGH